MTFTASPAGKFEVQPTEGGTLNAEWEALEKQRLYATWFERECPQLATCAPR